MEILSQQDLMMIVPSYGKAITAFGVIFFLSLMVLLVLRSFSGVAVSSASVFALSACAISGILILLFLVFSPRVDTGRNKYEVKLDETIDINEFYDKYEVIERRDKIWVIEDREVKDNANS